MTNNADHERQASARHALELAESWLVDSVRRRRYGNLQIVVRDGFAEVIHFAQTVKLRPDATSQAA